MDAPVYPPSAAFDPPVRLAHRLSSRDTPVAELQATPAAWAIVNRSIPGIDARLGNPMLKPHLTNFSLQSLVQFGVVDPKVFPTIDESLARLGEVK